MTVITNVENLQYDKIKFSLTVEKILAFASSSNFVREVKSSSSNDLHNDILRLFNSRFLVLLL